MKSLQGSITKGMKEMNEDSPAYLFKPYNVHDFHVMIESYIVQQIIQLENYKNFFVPIMQLSNTVIDVTRHLCWGDREISQKIIY